MVTFNSLADWQQYGDGSTSLADQMLSKIQANINANNAYNAAQAQKQMDFQLEANAKAMEFNHREAELNRNWQQMMSNTAHQREVADLLAAGLNPVLSATGGNGAPVTSGATAAGVTSSGAKAEADTSANASVTGLIGSLISSVAQRDIADLNATVAMRNSDIAAGVSKYVSDNALGGIYAQLAHDREMKELYPSSWYGMAMTLLDGLATGESSHPGFAWLLDKLGIKFDNGKSDGKSMRDLISGSGRSLGSDKYGLPFSLGDLYSALGYTPSYTPDSALK